MQKWVQFPSCTTIQSWCMVICTLTNERGSAGKKIERKNKFWNASPGEILQKKICHFFPVAAFWSSSNDPPTQESNDHGLTVLKFWRHFSGEKKLRGKNKFWNASPGEILQKKNCQFFFRRSFLELIDRSSNPGIKWPWPYCLNC